MTSKHRSGIQGNHSYRKALLPLALSLAVISLSAQADESWVSTGTHAAIQQDAVNHRTTLAVTGHPTIDAAQIAPLESSKALHVIVSLNLRHADQLETFLSQLNQPGHPNYQKFLTPEQFKAQYAPTEAQVQAVVAHLQKNGFSNIEVTPNHLLVSADGTAISANAAFNTSVKSLNYKGKQRFANALDAQVPQSLGGIVGSVLGLQNIAVPHTFNQRAVADAVAAQTDVKHAAAAKVGHNPAEFATIYNAGSTPTGSKTTVGIITWGDQTQTIADLKTFTTKAHLATVNTKVVPGGSGTLADDGDPSEWDLDSQDIVGISGGVKQLIFYSAINGDSDDSGLTDANISAAFNKAVTDNVAKIINVSLGSDETSAQNAGTQAADDKIFAAAQAQGQIFSVSTGDSGVYQWSSDPDPRSGAPGYVADGKGKVQIDLSHYGVSEPASSPYVVAVGGTALSTTSGKTWSSEVVWNDGLSPVAPGASPPDNNQVLAATGGGASLFEKAPAWQTANLSSKPTKRQLPDVAFDASASTGAIIIVNGEQQQWGGTSLSSPLFVGTWARIESANNNTLGLPTQNFYTYFPKDSAPLHDVTSGNNGYQGYGYKAVAGYDNSTGWGSFDIAKLNAYVTKYWGSSSAAKKH